MISAIFAADMNGAMGYNGSLPWPRNRYDMEWFREKTHGHVVVMGRNTWDDPVFPKPLPGRICYVATNRPNDLPIYARPISGNIAERLVEIEAKHPDKNIFVIGGPRLLEECQSYFEHAYVTIHRKQYRADVRIQLSSFLAPFQVKRCDTSPDFQCSFIKYENIFRRPTTSIE